MAITIKAIECPKCGSTVKTELKPDHFQCDSCGTEYFLDDDKIKTIFQPTGQQTTPLPPGNKSLFPFILWAFIIFIIIFVGFRLVDTSTDQAATERNTIHDNSWSSRDALLYLAADGRPVEMAFGTNSTYGEAKRSMDYVAFYDLRNQRQINRMPMPDGMTQGNESTSFDVRKFTNGDIYILENYKVLCQVPKGGYAVKEVTKTLFGDHPELVSGIAKIKMLYESEGEGFDLVANDGKEFIYLPVTTKLYTKKAFDDLQKFYYYYGHPVPGAVEQISFDFTHSYDPHNAGTGNSLMTFRYKAPLGDPCNFLPEWLENKQDTLAELKRYGISSYKDLTPGRTYFSQRVMYYDSEYVLITYRLTPADDAKRVIQCLNAQTGAIAFTTSFDQKYAPRNAIRYADGFVIEDNPNIFMLSLTGKISSYSNIMGEHP